MADAVNFEDFQEGLKIMRGKYGITWKSEKTRGRVPLTKSFKGIGPARRSSKERTSKWN